MQFLPTISAGSVVARLPLAGRSAEVIVAALLSPDEDVIALLAEAFAGDPPLVLWTICQAASRQAAPPESLDALASWLRENALDVLRWSTDQRTEEADDRLADKPIQQAIVTSSATADLAALAAADAGQPAAEAAYLLGMIHNSADWLELARIDTSTDPVENLLPDWILQFHQHAAWQYVDKASKALEAFATTGGRRDRRVNKRIDKRLDAKSATERAGETVSQWLLPSLEVGRRLPELTARLARLRQLEERFEETLQVEKLEALAEFAAGAGHEINNPLAIIGGRAQLFLRQETDPERRRELASINAQVRRAHEMIADLRLFARPPQPELEPIDLGTIIDGVIVELSEEFSQEAVSLVRVGQPDSIPITADPAHLSVALRALCRNAFEAIGRDGRIEIDARSETDAVRLIVRDTGPGIPAEHRRHLFDPFYSSRQAGRGLGMGLSKCWRIVMAHGGRIDVQSKPDVATEFIITLPG